MRSQPAHGKRQRQSSIQRWAYCSDASFQERPHRGRPILPFFAKLGAHASPTAADPDPTHLEQVALALIEAKADLEKQSAKGNTALILSCQNGHERVARALLVAKADPNKADAEGWVALMYACQNGHLEVSFPTLTPALPSSLAHPEFQPNTNPNPSIVP